jgi:hypothetical protein
MSSGGKDRPLGDRSLPRGTVHASGVPPNELSSALEHNERGATDGLSGCFRGEVLYQPVDEAADLSVKPLVVTKECTEHLGNGEGELVVRQPQQELLVHVLTQQEGPPL